MSYKFIITDRFGPVELDILSNELTIEYAASDENKSEYTTTLPSKLIFTGDAFKRVAALERSVYQCGLIEVTIQKKCVDGTNVNWPEVFSGRISLINGNWDFDKCKAELKAEELKPGQCYEDSKDLDFNILSVLAPKTVKLLRGTIEVQDCSGQFPVSGPGGDPQWCGSGSVDAGWAKQNSSEQVVDDLIHPPYVVFSYKYVRERITSVTSPGYPWINIGGNTWARKPILYKYIGFDDSQNGGARGWTSTYGGEIDNGVLVLDALQAFFNQYCPGVIVKSDFFQWNPDVISTTNYVTELQSKVRNLLFFQKSDVKRPGATGNATIATVKFSDLINALTDIFWLKWRIKDGFFRIEHRTYWGKDAGLNLMQEKYADYRKFKKNYTYKTDAIPPKETYSWQEAQNIDFVGLPILYTGGCADKSQEDKKHTINFITTDVELCFYNPSSDSKVVDDKGLVLMATEEITGGYYMLTEPPILDTLPRLNNTLGWAQLHRDYHKYDRPLRYGNMNGEDTTFLTIIPTKKGAAIKIPFCCDDVFNPDNYVIGPFGNGTVEKAVRNLKNDTLELELLYYADSGLTQNTAPVAANTSLTMPKNTHIDIDILPLVTDVDAGAYILSVEVVPGYGIFHGTAVVIPGLKIRYTPDADYTGDDAFTFAVYDNWNERSNLGAIVITITD
jgi:hypothetical protein